MHNVPDEIWELAELTREFNDAMDLYENQLTFYKEFVKDNDDLIERFESESEAENYFRNVIEDLSSKADEVQEIGGKLYTKRKNFMASEYSSEEFRVVPGMDYEGPEELKTLINHSFKDLKLLERMSEDLHEAFSVDYGLMQKSQQIKSLEPANKEINLNLSENITDLESDNPETDYSNVDVTRTDAYKDIMDSTEYDPEEENLYDLEDENDED